MMTGYSFYEFQRSGVICFLGMSVLAALTGAGSSFASLEAAREEPEDAIPSPDDFCKSPHGQIGNQSNGDSSDSPDDLTKEGKSMNSNRVDWKLQYHKGLNLLNGGTILLVHGGIVATIGSIIAGVWQYRDKYWKQDPESNGYGDSIAIGLITTGHGVTIAMMGLISFVAGAIKRALAKKQACKLVGHISTLSLQPSF